MSRSFTSDALLALGFSLGLVAAFSVGRNYGLRNAPEYLAAKAEQRARLDAEIAAADTEYEGSRQSVCDQIIDLVMDHLIADSADGPADP